MANTYYVSTTGNDANPGTLASPFRTLKKGAAMLQNAGDTCYVRGGTYTGSGNLPLTLNKAGASGSVITFSAYNNETVILDGQKTLPGGPDARGACASYSPDSLPYNYSSLVNINNAYITVSGLTIRNSYGSGLRVFSETKGIVAHDARVENCTIHDNNVYAVALITWSGSSPYNVTITGCDVYHNSSYLPRQHGQTPCDWHGAITMTGAHDVLIENCIVHENYGEGIIADANTGGSYNVTVRGCTFYDNMAGYCNPHAVRNMTIERNLFYRSTDNTFRGGAGADFMTITTDPYPNIDPSYHTDNVVVRNNIFVGNSWHIVSWTAVVGGTNPPETRPLGNVYIYNNTFVGATGAALYFANTAWQANAKCYIKNNIVYGCTAVDTGFSNASRFEADYNHWQSTPTFAGLQGANDVTGNPSLVDYTHRAGAGKLLPEKFRLTGSSTAISAGVDLSASFTKDYFDVTRSGSWDIGAHEYDGTSYPTPTASASASTTTPQVEDSVSFTGSASGGTAAYTYAWNFGDGKTSTTQNPSHAYASSGTYTVTLTIEDANGLQDTDTVTMNVSPKATTGGSGTAAADVELVVFDAGDASFTVTSQPSWILFFASGADTNDTARADANFAVGIHDAVNSQSYCYTAFADDNVSTTQAASEMNTGKAIAIPGYWGTADYYATVSSVSSSAVNLSWSGTAATGKIIALCGSGVAYQNVLASAPTLTTDGTGTTVSGDWTHAIMPANFRNDGNQGIIDFSLGFAARGGNQMCMAWSSEDGASSSTNRAVLRTDRIAARPLYADTIEITAWTTSGITLTPRGRSVNAACPILLLKLDTTKTDMYIDVVDLPTDTSATDYAVGFDWSAALFMLGTLTTTDTIKTDSSAGVFGMYAVEDGGTDRTILVYETDGATPTVAKSYTKDDFTLKGYDGTNLARGAATLSTTNVRLTLTVAPASTYKALLVAFEETAVAASGPTSDFDHDVTASTDYTDVVTVQDLSVGDGTNTVSSWSLHWGDTTATATGLTPGGTATHTYSGAGDYTLTHTVIDAAANEASSTKSVSIGVPLPEMSISVDPLTGTAPLTLTCSATASDPGGNEAWASIFWTFYNKLPDPDSSTTPLYYWALEGETVYTELPEAGEWVVEALGIQANTGEEARDRKTVTVTADDYTLDFLNTDGEVHVTGTYVANFIAYLDHSSPDDIEFEWTLGDGTTTGTYGLSTLTHTYSAVVVATNYTVVVTATLPDDVTVLTATRTNYINLYPTPVTPPTLEELYDDLVEVKKHLGILYDATWTQEGSPNTNVYGTTVVNVQWASDYSTYTLKENGTALSSQASVAACQANAGSYYITYSGGTLTVYVHPTGSGSPATNGKYYRWIGS